MKHGGVVLILDPSPLLANCLQQQLREFGLQARCVATVEHLCREAAVAALVFIELYLPDDNGFRLCRELCSRHPACTVVLLSGSGRATDHPWGQGAGALAVLARPVAAAELQRVLQQAGVLEAGVA